MHSFQLPKMPSLYVCSHNMYQVFCCYHLQSSNNHTYKGKNVFYFSRAVEFLRITLTARENVKAFYVLLPQIITSRHFMVELRNIKPLLWNIKPLMHMCIRCHFLADLHVTRHERETEIEKRIQNTQNKPCRVELVTSPNRDYRP